MASHFKKLHLAKFEIPTAVALNIFKFCGELHHVCRYLTDVSGEHSSLMFRVKEGQPHEGLNLRSAVLTFTATGTSNLADAFSAYLPYIDCVYLNTVRKPTSAEYSGN